MLGSNLTWTFFSNENYSVSKRLSAYLSAYVLSALLPRLIIFCDVCIFSVVAFHVFIYSSKM